MPRRDIHDIFEEAMFGKITGMSELMDAPSKFLRGQHRVLFHDPVQITLLAMIKGGNVMDNMAAGFLHLALDNAMSEGKKTLKKYVKKRRKRK